MFASLKSKIREETGSDFSKLTAKITSTTVQKIDNLRGRSHQGSSSSLNSMVSSDGLKEEGPIEAEEFKRRITKIDQEFTKRLEQKEQEWKEIIKEKDRRLQNLEKEKDEAYKQISNLKDSLKNSEDMKQKILEHRENSEQIESLQSQELSKVKQLVLEKDKELSEKSSALKEATSQLEKLRSELSRLRRQEEVLSDVQDDLEALRHSSARDLAHLATELAKSEQERKHLADLVVILRGNNEGSCESKMDSEKKLLEQRLEEAHLQLADIKTSWSDKIASLETQVGRLSRQAAEEGAERRRAMEDREKLLDKITQLEAELEFTKIELTNKETKIRRLTQDVNEMSMELKSLQLANEEEIQFLRTELDVSKTESKVIQKNLENVESKLGKSEDEISKLRSTLDLKDSTNNSLTQTIARLEKDLGEEKANSLNVQKTLTRVTSEKNAALLRNAEISQQMEMVKQEMRRQESDMNDLIEKITSLEQENLNLHEVKNIEQQLNSKIRDLEDQVAEKNQTIKTLQLRLVDLKKTLQQELRTPSSLRSQNESSENNGSVAVLHPSHVSTKNFPNIVRRDEDDVNFKYLKHVVIKFLTSRDYEAQHLIKAVSTLLKFTPEEEQLIHDTLEWKKSWFGSKPKSSKLNRTVHFPS